MMRSLHLEKRGLRGLAVAESFRQDSKRSVMAGVVMSRDLVVDGFVFGAATIGGDDATQEIIRMYEELRRSDISYLVTSGMIMAMYNVIDLKTLHGRLGIPVMGVSYRSSDGLEDAIMRRCRDDPLGKLRAYQDLGPRSRITLHTGSDIFVRGEGCGTHEILHLLDGMTLHGSIPEPLRVSQLLARSVLCDRLSL